MPNLTVPAIKKYAPKAKRREIRDHLARGLRLVIQPSGHKSWVVRFRRPDGRSGKLTLGPVELSDAEPKDDPKLGGALTLRQARELANQIDRQRARGIDVIEFYKADRSRKKADAVERAANTFGSAVREFFVDHRTRKWGARPRRWRASARMLGLDWPLDCDDPTKVEPTVRRGSLADTWCAKPLVEIDGHDVHGVVDQARKHGIPGLDRHTQGTSPSRGRKMHAVLSVLFAWLLQHRRIAVNPCIGVWRPPAAPARDRVLTDAEIIALWRASDAVAPYGPLFKLLLLTGTRLNEVASIQRGELVGNVWTIPPERAKNHRQHTLVLPPLVLGVIDSVPKVQGDFVFTRDGRGPLTGFSRAKTQLDEAMGGPAPWRLHDLRRTAATGMQKLGVSVEVIERALNHVSGVFGGIVATYQVDPLTDPTADALARWARYVALVTDPDHHAAHREFLANGNEEARKRSRDTFMASIAKGGDEWARYLKVISREPGKIVQFPRT
jgi:integrase